MFHILDLLKQPQVPVYSGAEGPLVHTAAMAREAATRWGKLQYAGAFDDDPAAVQPATGARLTGRRARRGAVDFLISEIEKYRDKITILAIGPMTNLALALRMRPDLETKIKQVVFMGGNFRVAGNASVEAEFNFWFDPEAARIVLRSRIPKKVMFGLDICNKAPIRKAHFDQIAAVRSPITDLYRADLGNRYPAFHKNPEGTAYMWDTLAAAYLLDPDYVTKTEAHYLDVETTWGRYYGATIPLDRKVVPHATPVHVALELDFPRVFKLYKEKLVGHANRRR
jgi:inosine-uridine nucleoside N-ribohydrolase